MRGGEERVGWGGSPLGGLTEVGTYRARSDDEEKGSTRDVTPGKAGTYIG